LAARREVLKDKKKISTLAKIKYHRKDQTMGNHGTESCGSQMGGIVGLPLVRSLTSYLRRR
jgi:hypothetical protein